MVQKKFLAKELSQKNLGRSIHGTKNVFGRRAFEK